MNNFVFWFKRFWFFIAITDIAGKKLITIRWVRDLVFLSNKLIGVFIVLADDGLYFAGLDGILILLKNISFWKSVYLFYKGLDSPLDSIQENLIQELSLGDYWDLVVDENITMICDTSLVIRFPPFLSSVFFFSGLIKFFDYSNSNLDTKDTNDIKDIPFVNKGVDDLKGLDFVSDGLIIICALLNKNNNMFSYFVIVVIIVVIVIFIICIKRLTSENTSLFITGLEKFLNENTSLFITGLKKFLNDTTNVNTRVNTNTSLFITGLEKFLNENTSLFITGLKKFLNDKLDDNQVK